MLGWFSGSKAKSYDTSTTATPSLTSLIAPVPPSLLNHRQYSVAMTLFCIIDVIANNSDFCRGAPKKSSRSSKPFQLDRKFSIIDELMSTPNRKDSGPSQVQQIYIYFFKENTHTILKNCFVYSCVQAAVAP